jgi:hypothetical protein
MSAMSVLPNHLRPRREKVFGPARGIPLVSELAVVFFCALPTTRPPQPLPASFYIASLAIRPRPRHSKAASQARWRAAPENQGYFRGPVNVARVPGVAVAPSRVLAQSSTCRHCVTRSLTGATR